MGNIYSIANIYLMGRNSAVQAQGVLHLDTAHLFSSRLTGLGTELEETGVLESTLY